MSVVIAEDLALREFDRYLEDLVNISTGQHLKALSHGICKSFCEGSSSSSKHYMSYQDPEICETRASVPRYELLVDRRAVIVGNTCGHATVPFICKG